MAILTVHGAKPARITVNGAAVKTVTVNGVVVWQSNVTVTDLIDWNGGSITPGARVTRLSGETLGGSYNGIQLGYADPAVGYENGSIAWTVYLTNGHVYWYNIIGGQYGASNGRIEVQTPWNTYGTWLEYPLLDQSGAVLYSGSTGYQTITAKYGGILTEALDPGYALLYALDVIDMTAAGLAWTEGNITLLQNNCRAMNGSKTLQL